MVDRRKTTDDRQRMTVDFGHPTSVIWHLSSDLDPRSLKGFNNNNPGYNPADKEPLSLTTLEGLNV